MSQHDSYRNGLILPILQALATALLSGLCAGFVSALVRAEQPGGIALTVGALAGLLSWLSFRRRWQAIYEAILKVHIDQDNYSEREPEIMPAKIRLNVLSEDGREGQFLDLPATHEQLQDLGVGLINKQTPFAVSVWTGRGRPFSRNQFELLRSELIARGFMRWINEYSREQGVELTGKGKAIMRHFASEVDSLPPIRLLSTIRKK